MLDIYYVFLLYYILSLSSRCVRVTDARIYDIVYRVSLTYSVDYIYVYITINVGVAHSICMVH